MKLWLHPQVETLRSWTLAIQLVPIPDQHCSIFIWYKVSETESGHGNFVLNKNYKDGMSKNLATETWLIIY